jgi:hypothetical protein
MTRVVILVVIAEKNEYNTTHIWMPQEWIIVGHMFVHVRRVWYYVPSTELDKDEDMTKK